MCPKAAVSHANIYKHDIVVMYMQASYSRDDITADERLIILNHPN